MVRRDSRGFVVVDVFFLLLGFFVAWNFFLHGFQKMQQQHKKQEVFSSWDL